MLWIPSALDWWHRNPTRTQVMSTSDLARVFGAEQWPKLKHASQKKHAGGRPTGMVEERVKEAESLLARIRQLGGKWGALRIAAREEYPNDDALAAYNRARKTLQHYRQYRKAKEQGPTE